MQEKDAAAQKSRLDLADADIVKRGSGVDTQLGVVGAPRTEGFRTLESQPSVSCSDTVSSK